MEEEIGHSLIPRAEFELTYLSPMRVAPWMQNFYDPIIEALVSVGKKSKVPRDFTFQWSYS